VLSGLPAKNYRADVHLTPDGEGTRITWGGSFVPKVPGTGALIRGFLIRTVGAFARRLAAEAERT
jgi:hypothetical protein